LQVLEGDFLDVSRTMGIASGHIVQGVQFNLFGQRESYWLYNYHPGGVYMLNPRGGILSQPVPASQVMHTYCILRPGQVRGAPWPAGGYRDYLMTELQGIGAGIDVPYELLSGDLSNVNYSSYRAGMLGFRNAIEAFRWLTLIPMYCRPTWRRFIDTLVFIGRI